MTANALIIDDERDICELINMSLTGQDVRCDSAYNIKTGIKMMKEKQYDVIFCDIRLPDGDGLDLLTHVNKHYPGTPMCMITAHGNMDMAIRALKLGAFDFINKPFELKQLRSVCRAALKSSENAHLSPKAAKNSESSGKTAAAAAAGSPRQIELIGEAPVMGKVRQMISKVARSQAPVFIHGESGTGKEVAARSIHEQSRRKGGPFIAVNCGAIPENLVESEFFGYKKGAFTGANQDTDGLFVAANGGTLFLDEVADLPLAMQVKLLRAIQERAVRPIGGDSEEAVDARIISATHHDLAAKVKAGEFREDLYYRLNVIGLTMPPLREREGDVIVLAQYLLNKLTVNAGYPEAHLSIGALKKLQNYSFPGNVRELENVLERALTFMDGNTIEPDDIHINAQLHESDAVSMPLPPAAPLPEEDFSDELWEDELEAIPVPAPTPKSPPVPHSSFDAFSFDVEPGFIPEPAKPRAVKPPPRPTAARTAPPPETAPETDSLLPDEPPSDLEQYMQDMEKQILLKALEESGNNKTKAAEALGISFRAIRYKLKKFGID